MLRVKNISAGYSNKQVLFDVSFEIKRGSFVLLVGANGSGKSTLFKTIYGLIKPWRSPNLPIPNIWFNGEEILNEPSFSYIRKGLMYVPQKDNFFPNLDVDTNIQISGSTILNYREYSNRMDEVLEIFPALKHHRYKNIAQLSGGERQMAILAMSLIHRPKMILLDEPTLNLAPSQRKIILKKLSELNKNEGITIFMIEHKIMESLQYVDNLIGIKVGKITGNYCVTNNFNSSILKDILL